MVGLVRAVAAIETANLGRHAVVGGLAVCARLNQAHRATADVDTVVDETMPPDAVSALLLLDDTRPDPTANHRVYINETKVEILGVGPIGEAEDLSWATDADGLFVRAHTLGRSTAPDQYGWSLRRSGSAGDGTVRHPRRSGSHEAARDRESQHGRFRQAGRRRMGHLPNPRRPRC